MANADEMFEAGLKKQKADDAFEAGLKKDKGETPAAPTEALPPDVDEALVKKIMDSGASVGSPVGREEAVRRATNVSALMKEGPNQPTISQGEGPSAFGAFTEGAIQGAVPFGVGPIVIPPLEAAFSYIPSLENLSLEAQARRREENAGTFLAGEVAGSLATGATSLLVKGGSRIAETAAGRFVRAFDVGERVGARVSARAAGTTLGKEVEAIERVVPILKSRVQNGIPLTKAENQVLQTYERLASPTLYEKAATKIIPRLGNATTLAEENATRILAERAVADKMTRSLKALGTKGFGTGAAEVGKAVLGPATTAAIDAASYAGSSAVREFEALTPEQVEATGENVASVYFKNAAKGGVTGAALGVAIPSVSAGLAQVGRLVRWAGDGLMEKVYPAIGSIATRATKDEIREAVVASGALSKIDLRKREKQFVAQLQAQYDAADKYLGHLRAVANKAADDLGLPANAPERSLGQLDDVLGDVRNKYMFKDTSGKYIYRSDAVVDDFYKGNVVDIEGWATDDAGNIIIGRDGNPVKEVIGQKLNLPTTLNNLQERLQTLEQAMADVYGRARNPTDVTVPGQLMRSRKYGARLMQEEALPYQIRAPYAELGDTAAVGLYTRQGTPFEPNFGMLKQIAEVRQADVKSGGRGLLELGGAGWLLSQVLDAGAGAAGYGAAAKYTMDMLFYPGNIIDNYRTAQTIVSYGIKRSNDFARYLVAGPSGAKNFVGKSLPIKELYKVGVAEGVSDGEPSNISLDKRGVKELYEQDKAFLDKLQGEGGMQAIEDTFSGDLDALDEAFPNMANAAGTTLPRQVQFLSEKMKKYITSDAPTDAQLFQYGMYSKYVREPDTIYDDIASKGYVPQAAFDVLTQVYPARYNQLVQDVLGELADAQANKQKINSKQMVIINKLLGRENKGFTTPYIAKLQESFGKQAPTPPRGGGMSNRRVELEREGTSQQ